MGDEDAATLTFGDEFPTGSVECLADAEVATILDHTLKAASGDRPFLRKALEYAKRGVGARPMESVKTEAVHIRQALDHLDFSSGGQLHPFEIASLTNLMGKDSEPEEARALVPSLTRYPNESIIAILEVVSQAKTMG